LIFCFIHYSAISFLSAWFLWLQRTGEYPTWWQAFHQFDCNVQRRSCTQSLYGHRPCISGMFSGVSNDGRGFEPRSASISEPLRSLEPVLVSVIRSLIWCRYVLHPSLYYLQ
jgi:hypothetical protein